MSIFSLGRLDLVLVIMVLVMVLVVLLLMLVEVALEGLFQKFTLGDLVNVECLSIDTALLEAVLATNVDGIGDLVVGQHGDANSSEGSRVGFLVESGEGLRGEQDTGRFSIESSHNDCWVTASAGDVMHRALGENGDISDTSKADDGWCTGFRDDTGHQRWAGNIHQDLGGTRMDVRGDHTARTEETHKH